MCFNLLFPAGEDLKSMCSATTTGLLIQCFLQESAALPNPGPLELAGQGREGEGEEAGERSYTSEEGRDIQQMADTEGENQERQQSSTGSSEVELSRNLSEEPEHQVSLFVKVYFQLLCGIEG